MSYQIKSTPYFQRMLSKSKRNGELQRLKEEYERIKEFSDHTIALRIRQVRLRRLFREIQDINAASSQRIKPPRRQKKTYEQIRAETLARARDLGTEYSRENGLNVQRYPVVSVKNSLFCMGQKSAVENQVSSTAKRLHYGNIKSYENMLRFRTGKSKVDGLSATANNDLRTASSILVDRVEKLRNRVNYGNPRPSVGTSKSKANLTRADSSHSSQRSSQWQEDSNSLKTAQSSADLEQDVVKNYTLILDDTPAVPSDHISSNKERQEEDLANLWSELKNRIPILRAVPLKELMGAQECEETELAIAHEPLDETQMDESCDSLAENSFEEYTLRKIDNDRNLPLSQLKPEIRQTALTNADSNEDVRIAGNEEIIKISNLRDEDKDNEAEWEPQKESSSDERSVDHSCITGQRPQVSSQSKIQTTPLSLHLKTVHHPPMLIQAHVKDFVKLYEPFPRDQDNEGEEVVEKNLEIGVAKYRKIFEHQGE